MRGSLSAGEFHFYMTEDSFRNSSEKTAHLSALLQDPVLQEAFAIAKAKGDSEDVPDDADALASVRLLAKQKGRAGVITDIFTMATPLEREERERIPTFGTGLSETEAAEALGMKTT